MLVILLGHIDLSVPWMVTVGGMMSTAAAGWWGETGAALAMPFGMLCGLVFGLFNGLGVAFLRIPSMIFTLGVNAVAQGLMVLHTGGFAPQDHATDLMHWLATERAVLGIPNALFVWLAVGVRGRLRAAPHAVRPLHLRDRQPRGRDLPLGRRHARAC